MIFIPPQIYAKVILLLFGLLGVQKCTSRDLTEEEQKSLNDFYGVNSDGTVSTSRLKPDSKEGKKYLFEKQKELLREHGILAFIGPLSPFGLAAKKVKILFIIGLLFAPLISSLLFAFDRKIKVAILGGLYVGYFLWLKKHYEV